MSKIIKLRPDFVHVDIAAEIEDRYERPRRERDARVKALKKARAAKLKAQREAA